MADNEMVEMTITVDTELLDAAERLFAKQGMTVEVAINLFLRECIRIGGLPFEIDEEMRSLCKK